MYDHNCHDLLLHLHAGAPEDEFAHNKHLVGCIYGSLIEVLYNKILTCIMRLRFKPAAVPI